MDIYLVGGAVRDELLGRPVKEKDWVVVGGTAEELLSRGFRRVGRDFPVFLHPTTGEEYALARTERKTAPGHRGFAVRAGRDVSLGEDLARRDLTVNAMAKTMDGRLIDPFGGQRDLVRRTLRHVGEAFREDPLRVFRVARFAAELVDFSVHESTIAVMADMAAHLGELSAERVWAEFRKALAAACSQRFVETLCDADCLGPWLPELENAVIDPRPHSAQTRFGGLGWSLGETAVRRLGRRLKAPNDYVELAVQTARHGRVLANWRTVDATQLYFAAKAVGALRKPSLSQRVFALVGTLGETAMSEPQRLFAQLVAEVNAQSLRHEALSGPALGRRIEKERIKRLAALISGADGGR